MAASVGGKGAMSVQTRPIAKRKRRNQRANSQNSDGYPVMSTGKRLAKRSIIGTRVCAQGMDGFYYSGTISAVNTPQHAAEANGLTITEETRYKIRFDYVPPRIGRMSPNSDREYEAWEIIGSGFAEITGAKLQTGQKVYLTYNTREVQAEVVHHYQARNEVIVLITLPGQEDNPLRLTRRIEDIRLLESRKSARLADTDTDFARLADMGGDRKRPASHNDNDSTKSADMGVERKRPSSRTETDSAKSADMGVERKRPSSRTETDSAKSADAGGKRSHFIDVPEPEFVRNRRPSSSNGSERSYNSSIGKEEQGAKMDACSAAMVLMSLSTPPKNPLPIHCAPQFGSWGNDTNGQTGTANPLASEGITSNSSGSSPSWRSNTPSPPLSDDIIPNGWHHDSRPPIQPLPPTEPTREMIHQNAKRKHRELVEEACSSSDNTNYYFSRDLSPPADYLDLDAEDDFPYGGRPSRKRRLSSGVQESDENDSRATNSSVSESELVYKPMTVYRCTWIVDNSRGIRCDEISSTWNKAAEHVLSVHLHGQRVSEDEEDFYIVDEVLDMACSPPTKSHWDMVKPVSADPEYQKRMRAALPQTQNNTQIAAAMKTQDIIIRNVFSMAPQQPSTPAIVNGNKQFKPAPRPLQACNSSNVNLVTVSLGKMPNSPRRVRGDTKKCRKVYGMQQKELWCTQCKWKKACSRFTV